MDSKIALSKDLVGVQSGRGTDVNVSKRSLSQVISATAALLISAQIFVACQPKSGGGVPHEGTVQSPTAAPSESTTAQGTGDTTGGNGFRDKMFEAHGVPDITKTKPWIDYIQPIDEHISRNSSPGAVLGRLARKKLWIIAPLTLEQIEKKVLGVEFIKDPIQQLALQDSSTVWITQNIYDSKDTNDRDRAYTLMHELMASLYVLKFAAFEKACLELDMELASCRMLAARFQSTVAEPARPLNKEDYANIRGMTHFMMNEAIKQESDLLETFLRFGYDRRFFALNNEPGDDRVITPTSVETLRRLSSAVAVKRVPKTCVAIGMASPDTNQTAQCDLSVKFERVNDVYQRRIIEFTIQEANGPVKFVSDSVSADYSTEYTLRPTTILGSNEKRFIDIHSSFAVPAGSTTIAVGQRIFLISIAMDTSLKDVAEVKLQELRVTDVLQSSPSTNGKFHFTDVRVRTASPALQSRTDYIMTNETVTRYNEEPNIFGDFSLQVGIHTAN